MKKKILSSLLLIGSGLFVNGQPPVGQVFEHFGMFNQGTVHHDAINSFSEKVFVNTEGMLKISPSGQINFAKSYDANGNLLLPCSVIETNAGYTFVANSRTIVGVDFQGTPMWCKEYSHPSSFGSIIQDIALSPNGDPVLIVNTSASEIAYQIFELDAASGSVIQHNQFSVSSIMPQAYPTNFIQTNSGYKLLLKTGAVGAFLLIDFDNSLSANFATRHDPTGSGNHDFIPIDILETTNGEIVVTGLNTAHTELNVIKLNSSHSLLASKSYQVNNNTDDFSYDHENNRMVETPDLTPFYLQGMDWNMVMQNPNQAITIAMVMRSPNWANEKVFVLQIDNNMNALVTRHYDFGADVLELSIIENHKQEIVMLVRDINDRLVDYHLEGDFTGCHSMPYNLDLQPLSGFSPNGIEINNQEEELLLADLDANENEFGTESREACSNKSPLLKISDDWKVEFSLYPNPSNGSFILEYKGENNADVEILNSLGQMVYKGQISGGKNDISVTEVESGIYTILIKSDELIQSKRLFIK